MRWHTVGAIARTWTNSEGRTTITIEEPSGALIDCACNDKALLARATEPNGSLFFAGVGGTTRWGLQLTLRSVAPAAEAPEDRAQ